jgi:hypothetical protein
MPRSPKDRPPPDFPATLPADMPLLDTLEPPARRTAPAEPPRAEEPQPARRDPPIRTGRPRQLRLPFGDQGGKRTR